MTATTPGGYPNMDPHYISPEDERVQELTDRIEFLELLAKQMLAALEGSSGYVNWAANHGNFGDNAYNVWREVKRARDAAKALGVESQP